MLQGCTSRWFIGSDAKCKMQKRRRKPLCGHLFMWGSCCSFAAVSQRRTEEERTRCRCCAHGRKRRSSTPVLPVHSGRPVWDEKYSRRRCGPRRRAKISSTFFVVFTPYVQWKSNVKPHIPPLHQQENPCMSQCAERARTTATYRCSPPCQSWIEITERLFHQDPFVHS